MRALPSDKPGALPLENGFPWGEKVVYYETQREHSFPCDAFTQLGHSGMFAFRNKPLECPSRVKASQVALKQLTQRAMRLKQITEEPYDPQQTSEKPPSDSIGTLGS
jgi:hypothetical protein